MGACCSSRLDAVGQSLAIEQGAQLLQIHPLEPVGRAARTLDESVPDLQESVYALVETCRLRAPHEDRIQIQIDPATLPGIAERPEQVFADRTEGRVPGAVGATSPVD